MEGREGEATIPLQCRQGSSSLGLWNNSGQASKAAAGPALLGRWIFSEVLSLVRGRVGKLVVVKGDGRGRADGGVLRSPFFSFFSHSG